MSSITPPASPPSPTMSMDSINGLPLQLESALQQQQQQQQRKIRVMIVDDNSINLAILTRILDQYFADTVELTAVMTSGVAALEKLRSEPVDLILMDIDMPGLTGVETTTAIRQNSSENPILDANQNIPVIAVTTSDGEAQKELYLQVGMSDCVSKPIDVPKLRLAIENAFNSSADIVAV
ncbi:sensitivity to red-light reduced protein [Mortierella sp. GBA30]|nr:sensitivity to red-light reduced protein [Mortierella sp. GBA30]